MLLCLFLFLCFSFSFFYQSFFVASARSWCHGSACNHNSSLIMFIDFNIEINKTISTPYAQFCFLFFLRGGGGGNYVKTFCWFPHQSEVWIRCEFPSPLVSDKFLDLRVCRRKRLKTNMSACGDVHVRICGQEIIKYDLEIKALIQVRLKRCFGSFHLLSKTFFSLVLSSNGVREDWLNLVMLKLV